MPAVSVIVPVYNTEEYLTRCVNSILSQTFSDFELILVDNGSTDTCPLICDEYAGSDERVVVIHKKEKGAGNARNAGLDYALQSDSKWNMFVDSDDWIDPCCLELLCRSAVQGNTKVQVCDYARAAGQDNTVQFAVGDVRSITPERLYCKKHILSIVPWAKLYDKEYIPPVKEGVLSKQAAELRRQYYAAYRKKTGPTQARREYMKRYREKNKDKISKYNQDYWERKAVNEILET